MLRAGSVVLFSLTLFLGSLEAFGEVAASAQPSKPPSTAPAKFASDLARDSELFKNSFKPTAYKVGDDDDIFEDSAGRKFLTVTAIELQQAVAPEQVFTSEFKKAIRLTREAVLNGHEPLIKELDVIVGKSSGVPFGQSSFDLVTNEGTGFVAERMWLQKNRLYHVVMIRFSNATLARDAFDRDFEKAMALTIEPKAESTALRLLKLQIGEAFALGEQGRSTGSRGSPSVARNTRAAQKSSRPSCSTFDIDPTYRASSGPAPKPTEAQLARACGDGAVTFLREMRTGLQQMADAATQMCGGTATVSTPKNPFAANTFREGFNLFLLNIGQAQEQEARSNCIGGTMVGMVAIGTVVGLATSVKNALLASRPLEAVDALVGSKLDSWPCLNSKGRTQATCDFISRLAATYFTGKASGAFKLAGRGARKGLRVVQDSQIAAALKSTRSKFAKRAEPVKAPAAVAPKPLRITGGPEFQMRPVNKPNTRALQTYTEKTGVKVEVREFGYDRFIVESETNRGLFSLKYKLRTDPTTKEMYIHGIVAGVEQTPDKLGHRADLKGNGFYSHLMERMVRENPQARAIEAKLEYDNLAQINKMIKEGYSVEQAIRSTPSYRVYSENGFTQIDLSTLEVQPRADGSVGSILYRVRKP